MYTIELSEEELRLVHAALQSYRDDFGHDEGELVRAIKALLARLPEPPTPHPEQAPDTSVTEL